MQSSFQLEVKLMYREFMKIIYKMKQEKRVNLLEKTRKEFKHGSKIPRRNIHDIDYAFHRAQRELHQLRQGNIISYTTYTPRSSK